VAQLKRKRRNTGSEVTWVITAVLYGLYEKGWNLAQLVEAGGVDPKDVVRYHKDAAKGLR
jgi:hypothetical protein